MEWLDIIRHASDSVLRSVMGMRARFLVRRATKPQKNPYDRARPKPRPIVASRPTPFEDRYIVCDNSRVIDTAFSELRVELFSDCDLSNQSARSGQGGRLIFRELGKTSEGRPFMFFKPFNDFGWLVERSGAGWRISRAEKIVSQQMFLRSNGDPWDVVLLYSDPKGEGSVRVKSARFASATLMSLPVYQQRMREAFGVELAGNAH